MQQTRTSGNRPESDSSVRAGPAAQAVQIVALVMRKFPPSLDLSELCSELQDHVPPLQPPPLPRQQSVRLTGVERSRHQSEQVLRELEDLPFAPFPAAHLGSDGFQGGTGSVFHSGGCVLLRPPASSCVLGAPVPGANDDHEGGEPLLTDTSSLGTGAGLACAPARQVINIVLSAVYFLL